MHEKPLFHLEKGGTATLRARVRELLVAAILDGNIPAGKPAPPSRTLASQLGVGRNTVLYVYDQLVKEGYLIAYERRGYYVAAGISNDNVAAEATEPSADRQYAVDLSHRLICRPSDQRNIIKPRNWRTYPYPFIYGQLDSTLFPNADWRDCCRQALTALAIQDWASDHLDDDHPELAKQVRTRILPRRGVWAQPEELLITMGTQHALYMLAELLTRDKRVGIEEPGYPDARNIFSLSAARVVPLPLDDQGLIVGDEMRKLDCLYTTPSHQSPTTVTMTLARRHALLERAAEQNFLIIEDDYENETNYTNRPIPTLKSLDQQSRVIYVGSLSKSLAPGLRFGFMVGPEELIFEARALRRLMLRHPPTNNELALTLFLSQGHYDALSQRLRKAYEERWHIMREALDRHLPELVRRPSFGGTSFWLQGPQTLDCRQLQRKAAVQGVLIEPGDIFFAAEKPPPNYFRLGFSSIAVDRIDAGVRRLAALIKAAA